MRWSKCFRFISWYLSFLAVKMDTQLILELGKKGGPRYDINSILWYVSWLRRTWTIKPYSLGASVALIGLPLVYSTNKRNRRAPDDKRNTNTHSLLLTDEWDVWHCINKTQSHVLLLCDYLTHVYCFVPNCFVWSKHFLQNVSLFSWKVRLAHFFLCTGTKFCLTTL